MKCIFCLIKENKKKILYEDNYIYIIKDINPQYIIHNLIITKKHIKNINFLYQEKDKNLILSFLKAPVILQKILKLDGYKIMINCGKRGDQIINHLHMHFFLNK